MPRRIESFSRVIRCQYCSHSGLELMKDMLGDSDKVYFIPEGADITLFLGTDKPVVNP